MSGYGSFFKTKFLKTPFDPIFSYLLMHAMMMIIEISSSFLHSNTVVSGNESKF